MMIQVKKIVYKILYIKLFLAYIYLSTPLEIGWRQKVKAKGRNKKYITLTKYPPQKGYKISECLKLR